MDVLQITSEIRELREHSQVLQAKLELLEKNNPEIRDYVQVTREYQSIICRIHDLRNRLVKGGRNAV